MEHIISNSIADYMNDEDFMHTLSMINNSHQIKKRRRKVLLKRSANSLNNVLLVIKQEYNLNKLYNEKYNKRELNNFFDLLYTIKSSLLIKTSINPLGKNNEYSKNYNVPVKHVLYPCTRSILRTPLKQVKERFSNLKSEIIYSKNICPIYRVGFLELKLLKKFPNIRALIY